MVECNIGDTLVIHSISNKLQTVFLVSQKTITILQYICSCQVWNKIPDMYDRQIIVIRALCIKYYSRLQSEVQVSYVHLLRAIS